MSRFAANGLTLSPPAVLVPGVVPGAVQQKMNGPWTTGMMTQQILTLSPPVQYTLTGSDQRTAGGQGFISLVSGGLANRPGTTGPSTTRGMLTMELAPVPEPGLGLGLLAGAGLIAAIGRSRRSA